MSDAVVHPNDGLVPQRGQHARCEGDALERGAHARALGIAYYVDVGDAEVGFAESVFDEGDDVGAVVAGGVFGEEAFARGGVEGVSDVGKDDGGGGGFRGGWVLD